MLEDYVQFFFLGAQTELQYNITSSTYTVSILYIYIQFHSAE
jgi:hypothetical protein